MEASATPNPEKHQGIGWFKLLSIILLTIAASVAITLWVLKTYIFPDEFKPVVLKPQEEKILSAKLANLELTHSETSKRAGIKPGEIEDGVLKPEVYSEVGASRQISFSERELNAMLAKNTDLAQKVAIDLSEDLISAKLLFPMDEDFPVFGGKTLRGKAGVEFAFENGKPIVKLRGISIMGVPIPNAWMGGLKNIDLVKEFGSDAGFWKAFSDGVEALHVKEGHLLIHIKE